MSSEQIFHNFQEETDIAAHHEGHKKETSSTQSTAELLLQKYSLQTVRP